MPDTERAKIVFYFHSESLFKLESHMDSRIDWKQIEISYAKDDADRKQACREAGDKIAEFLFNEMKRVDVAEVQL